MTAIEKNERKQMVRQDINKLLQKEIVPLLKKRGTTNEEAYRVLEDILIWVHLVIDNDL